MPNTNKTTDTETIFHIKDYEQDKLLIGDKPNDNPGGRGKNVFIGYNGPNGKRFQMQFPKMLVKGYCGPTEKIKDEFYSFPFSLYGLPEKPKHQAQINKLIKDLESLDRAVFEKLMGNYKKFLGRKTPKTMEAAIEDKLFFPSIVVSTDANGVVYRKLKVGLKWVTVEAIEKSQKKNDGRLHDKDLNKFYSDLYNTDGSTDELEFTTETFKNTFNGKTKLVHSVLKPSIWIGSKGDFGVKWSLVQASVNMKNSFKKGPMIQYDSDDEDDKVENEEVVNDTDIKDSDDDEVEEEEFEEDSENSEYEPEPEPIKVKETKSTLKRTTTSKRNLKSKTTAILNSV